MDAPPGPHRKVYNTGLHLLFSAFNGRPKENGRAFMQAVWGLIRFYASVIWDLVTSFWNWDWRFCTIMIIRCLIILVALGSDCRVTVLTSDDDRKKYPFRMTWAAIVWNLVWTITFLIRSQHPRTKRLLNWKIALLMDVLLLVFSGIVLGMAIEDAALYKTGSNPLKKIILANALSVGANSFVFGLDVLLIIIGILTIEDEISEAEEAEAAEAERIANAQPVEV